MPEQISKYPDVTLQVLKGAGAKCGEGAAQKILTQCPAARFCALPTGEICVYGIEEIPHMTQIDMREIAAVVVPRTQLNGMESSAAPWLEAFVEQFYGLSTHVVLSASLPLAAAPLLRHQNQ